MARGFRRTVTGRVVVRLDDAERALLRSLLQQVHDLVAPEAADPDADPLASLVGIDPDAVRPDDPALVRLLPDAYADDDEASADFRRFTERSLREGKAANARTAVATLARSGDKVVLTDDEATAWLLSLNDLRLALGVRLGIGDDPSDLDDPSDMSEGLADDDPRSALAAVYDWLTWLQDSLVSALAGGASPSV